MKKYKLRQEFGIMEENGTPIKECSIQIYVNEYGLGQGQVMNLFNTIAAGYISLLSEECRIYDKEPDWKLFAGTSLEKELKDMDVEKSRNDIKKGWFK